MLELDARDMIIPVLHRKGCDLARPKLGLGFITSRNTVAHDGAECTVPQEMAVGFNECWILKEFTVANVRHYTRPNEDTVYGATFYVQKDQGSPRP